QAEIFHRAVCGDESRIRRGAAGVDAVVVMSQDLGPRKRGVVQSHFVHVSKERILISRPRAAEDRVRSDAEVLDTVGLISRRISAGNLCSVDVQPCRGPIKTYRQMNPTA